MFQSKLTSFLFFFFYLWIDITLLFFCGVTNKILKISSGILSTIIEHFKIATFDIFGVIGRNFIFSYHEAFLGLVA